MADSNSNIRRLVQLEFKATPREALLNQYSITPTPLPLTVSLKRAVVMAGASGYIPHEHARRLISLLKLEEV
jgi:hypothetical protein